MEKEETSGLTGDVASVENVNVLSSNIQAARGTACRGTLDRTVRGANIAVRISHERGLLFVEIAAHVVGFLASGDDGPQEADVERLKDVAGATDHGQTADVSQHATNCTVHIAADHASVSDRHQRTAIDDHILEFVTQVMEQFGQFE